MNSRARDGIILLVLGVLAIAFALGHPIDPAGQGADRSWAAHGGPGRG